MILHLTSNLFLNKYEAEIQLPDNGIRLLSVHKVLAWFASGDFLPQMQLQMTVLVASI
jgi:hypothetical protein